MFLAIIVVTAGAVLILVLLLGVLRSLTWDQEHTAEEIHRPGHSLLVYKVPEGQDPAVLHTALSLAGFTSVPEFTGGLSQVAVDCPDGRARDRDRARQVIARAMTSGTGDTSLAVGHVRFEDER